MGFGEGRLPGHYEVGGFDTEEVLALITVVMHGRIIDLQKGLCLGVTDENRLRNRCKQQAKELLTPPQFLLHPFAIGDVPRNAKRACDISGGVPEGKLGGQHPCLPAVRPCLPLFLRYHGTAPVHEVLLVVRGRPCVLLGEEIEIGLAEQFTEAAAPESEYVRLVGKGEASLQVLEVDIVGEVIQQHVEQVSLLIQPSLHLTVAGDIAECPHPADSPAADSQRLGMAFKYPPIAQIEGVVDPRVGVRMEFSAGCGQVGLGILRLGKDVFKRLTARFHGRRRNRQSIQHLMVVCDDPLA